MVKNRILLFVVILLGCSTPKKITHTVKSGNYNEIIIGEIKEVTLDLAREKCVVGSFSFCSDGHEQPYRLHPLFVTLKKEDFLASYDTVFMFPPDNVLKQIRAEGLEAMDTWKMEMLFSDSLGNVLTYNNDEFYEKVKTYYRKNKISQEASCDFSYQAYKMSIRVMYGGTRQIILPDFNKKSNSLIKEHTSEVYYIISIASVKAIE